MQGDMQLGNLPGRTLAATNAPSLCPSSLFFINDLHTHTPLLVDTGSEVSVIPPSSTARKHPPDKLPLAAVNDTPIRTYDKNSLTLNLGLRRALPWIFIVADVQHPILGADFLRHLGYLVDMKQCQLRGTLTHFKVQGIIATKPSPSPSIISKDSNNQYLCLLSEFPALTQVCSPKTPIKHNINHHIEVTGRLTAARPRRLAPERL